MQTIKTITLHEPYASYIRDNHKIFETRHWTTTHRGLLAIHAGKTVNQDMIGVLADEFPDELSRYFDHDFKPGIVAICRLIHCYPTDGKLVDRISELEYALGDYSPGRFGWQLQLLETFDEPIPATGSQGLWDWTPPDGFFDNRVAVVGSRNFPEPDAIDQYIQTLPANTIVISGGAKGADEIAEYSAKQRGLKVISIPVLDHEWKDIGKHAGMLRNQAIVDMAGTVVAFMNGETPGTADSIKKAHAAGKTVIVNPHKSQSHTGESGTRLNRDDVLPIAQEMAGILKIACEQLQIAGSLRRQKPDVKDAELIAIAKVIDGQNALHWVLDRLVAEGTIEKALYGEKQTTRWGDKYRGFVYKNIKFEIFITQPSSFGYQYWLRTGPGDANTYFMKLCKFRKAPFHVEDGQVWWNDTALDIPDEKAWFRLLGIAALSPNQRSVATYTRLFEEEPHKWGEPKEFVPKPKQLKLGGDFNMYDEGALIAHLEKQEKLKPLSSKVEKPIEWSKPWLHPDGKQVIVFNGWQNGERNYALAPMDSPIAKQHARTIMGCTYMSETEALYKWIVKQNKKTVPVEHRVHCGYVMPEVYEVEFDKTTPVESVPLDNLIYTMPDVYESWVWWYYREQKQVDDNNHMIQVVRFTCGTHLLLDGHHRCEAAKQLNYTMVKAQVNPVPMTFAEATNPDARLEFLMDVLDEAYQILEEAKEYA